MARTPSTMLSLGTPLPHFELTDTDGQLWRSEDNCSGRPVVVMFISNHCPFVINMKPALSEFGKAYAGRVSIVAIGSNDVDRFPQDGPDAMKQERALQGYTFPYLYDEAQSVAHAFQAACTPDFYVFDANQTLVYRGQFDDSRPGDGKTVTGLDLRTAVDAALRGEDPVATQKPSLGCNIKWKPGNEPAYFG